NQICGLDCEMVRGVEDFLHGVQRARTDIAVHHPERSKRQGTPALLAYDCRHFDLRHRTRRVLVCVLKSVPPAVSGWHQRLAMAPCDALDAGAAGGLASGRVSVRVHRTTEQKSPTAARLPAIVGATMTSAIRGKRTRAML